MSDIQLFAGRLTLGILFHRDELPGYIREHRVSIVAGFDSGLGKKILRHPIELGFCENDRLFRVGNVCFKICAQLGQLFAQLLNLFASRGR